MINNKTILITGGTGSFGKEFVKIVLKKYKKVKKLIVFSRDELKQHEMKKLFSQERYPCMRYFIGDIRDYTRLKLATKEVDFIVHAAALKQVDTAEYNPSEYIKTNVVGAQNIVEASIFCGVDRVIALSTDKASNPINLYGATKLCSDKLFIAANNIKGNRDIKFSVVRYGNVMGSRGSVIPLFLKSRESGLLKITNKDMTRFNISLDESVKFVIKSIILQKGGEIFVPKLKSFKIMDLCKSIDEKAKIKMIGIRPGEKLHEILCPADDSRLTLEFKNHFIIMPSANFENIKKKFIKNLSGETGKFVKTNFVYDSGTNPKFLKIKEIKNLLK